MHKYNQYEYFKNNFFPLKMLTVVDGTNLTNVWVLHKHLWWHKQVNYVSWSYKI